METLLSMIFVRPLRCRDCYHRFFRWPVTGKRHSPVSTQEAPGSTLEPTGGRGRSWQEVSFFRRCAGEDVETEAVESRAKG